jgi:hypothetical protein
MGDMRQSQGKLLRESTYADRLTNHLIREIAREVRRDGASFVLMAEKLHELDVRELEESGVPITGFTSIYEDGEQVTFKRDAHWTALGHERVSEILAQILAEQLEARAPRDSLGNVR